MGFEQASDPDGRHWIVFHGAGPGAGRGSTHFARYPGKMAELRGRSSWRTFSPRPGKCQGVKAERPATPVARIGGAGGNRTAAFPLAEGGPVACVSERC